MDKHDERYMWLCLAVIVVGTFMAILDSSIVNVAIPKMMTIFGAAESQIEWVLTGYMLTMSIVIPLTGYLTDRFGGKNIYVFALIIFTIGSALCGLATSTNTMIAARVVQAIGGGMIMPVGMTMLFQNVPLEKRGLALGFWGIAAMAAPAIGPTLSGYIVQYMDWRLIFTINIPVGIIGVTLAVLLLKDSPKTIGKKFDIFGGITSALGLYTLLLALAKVSDKGWTSPYTITLLTVAFLSLTAFVFIELNHSDPLLDLRVTKNFPFTLSLIISTITTIAMYGAIFLMPIYMQNLRGYSAMQSGMMMLPQAIITGIMMPISGRLFDRYGAKWLTIIGLIVVSGCTYMLSRLTLDTPYNTVMLIMAVRGFGNGLAMMPMQTEGMNSVPPAMTARATALNSTIRQVAGSLGIAMLTTVLQSREAFHNVIFSQSLNTSSPAFTKASALVQGLATTKGISPTAGKSLIFMQIYGSLIKSATVTAMNDTFIVATSISVFGVFIALFIRGKASKKVKISEEQLSIEL
ncbi:DHA2 family efflux MFS transporter permease subunit [Clostridium sp. C8-1-8]|uniref:DHA2 family efflux MFS transporter permease subunit n=1 Tax=Clostridium sp. C8-1-8 TaxID=2698831 RepID=UPI00136DAC6D|nr:DHA2 family efflux MFS transporter permease subunit [Clostridium sp. C8-1-8]